MEFEHVYCNITNENSEQEIILDYDMTDLRHSVQFAILDLPLFGERKNYHQLLPLFWLEMVHMMGLSIIIKNKSVGKCGKACFSTFVCFSLELKVCA